MQAPALGVDDWFELRAEPLDPAVAYGWAVRPDCGAVVLFSGTVRDHAEGRAGVQTLEYEAYESAVLERFAAVAAEARRRWPDVGRIAVWHRTGLLELGETAVIVVASAPHRGEAFEAARYAIDTVKATAPIWKHETWNDGAGWGADAVPIGNVDRATVTDPARVP